MVIALETDMNTNGTMTVPLGRGGKFGQLDVDTSRFNDTVHAHVYAYGLRQILNDAIADKNGFDNDGLVAKAQKRLDTLYAGELRSNRAEPADPVEAEMMRLARIAVVDIYRTKPEWAECKGKDRAARVVALRLERGLSQIGSLDDAIDAYLDAKKVELEREAKHNLAARAKNVAAAGEVIAF